MPSLDLGSPFYRRTCRFNNYFLSRDAENVRSKDMANQSSILYTASENNNLFFKSKIKKKEKIITQRSDSLEKIHQQL
jgi:hypothetical protein